MPFDDYTAFHDFHSLSTFSTGVICG